MEALSRQVIPVRYRHLETPTSYLRRLCEANSIDPDWMANHLRQRRVANGPGVENLGLVIAELGGPGPERFEAAHATALVGHPNSRGPWDKQAGTRRACLSCTAGEHIATYPHIRFAFCRRHGQWLGDGQTPQRPGVLDGATWRSERALRKLVTVGLVNRDLYETAWELTRDNAYLIGEHTWSDRLRQAHDSPGFRREVDDRIALFPDTVRVLQIVARPEFGEAVGSGRRDSTMRRAYLYRVFNWVGPDRWVLCEGIDQFFNRDDK